MKKHYCCFSGENYHLWTKNIVEKAPLYGADVVHVYDDLYIRECHPELIDRHKNLFSTKNPRGWGWFFWKPWLCGHMLSRMSPGDCAIYTDGDTFPVSSLLPLYEECDRVGLMNFMAVGWEQKRWNKRDCQVLMQMDTPYWLGKQAACARFMVFKKGAEIRFEPTRFYPEGGVLTPEKFFQEWYDYLSDIRINTFQPSVLAPEHPEFHEHRCDQSVQGNLVHRYGLKLYRECCGYGETLNPDGIPWPQDRDIMPVQIFEQNGSHSRDPNQPHHGSSFRNVFD